MKRFSLQFSFLTASYDITVSGCNLEKAIIYGWVLEPIKKLVQAIGGICQTKLLEERYSIFNEKGKKSMIRSQ